MSAGFAEGAVRANAELRALFDRHMGSVEKFLQRLSSTRRAAVSAAAILLLGILVWRPAAAAEPAPPAMSVQGQLSVSGTGAATYSIPLTLPPGTNGIAPNLSFISNS